MALHVPFCMFYVEFNMQLKVEPLSPRGIEIAIQKQVGRLQCKVVNYDERAEFARAAVSL